MKLRDYAFLTDENIDAEVVLPTCVKKDLMS
jgi:hypothetical protein